MRPNVDFRECLKDSPKFRASVEDAEQDLDLLEVKLEKLMKLCTAMIESGKVHNSANSLFILGLKEVAVQFSDDQLTTGKSSVSDALRRFTHVLTELQKFHTILLDQAQRSIVQSLGNFIKRDIRKVKETRKHFDKISNDLDAVLVKNSQASRNKPHECEEANNIVLATKSGFLHTALDYVFQVYNGDFIRTLSALLNVIHSKKNFDILDTVLAYLHAQNAYFHQGSDLFTDLETYMKQVASQVEDLSSAAERDRKEMENRHLLVQQKAFSEVQLNEDPGVNVSQDSQNQVVPSSDLEEEVKMEGYLFKRTSNTFKTWVRTAPLYKQTPDRRWFQIHDNQLVYRKRSKDSITVMEDDLRLCTVRPSFDLDRRFCFEVVSPARSHILQADSEHECSKWIRAIQDGVSMAYNNRKSQDATDDDKDDSYEAKDGSDTAGDHDGSSGISDTSTSRLRTAGNPGAKSSSMSRIQSAILQVPGNSLCCDCGASNPSWASINLGITLCIECSGIHRSLGVHISKVRSLTLDAWEVGLVRVMAELGNAVVNQIYEAKVDESVAAKPNASSTRAVREAWIKAKYVTKSFTKQIPIPKPDSPRSHVARRWSVCKRKKKSSAGKPDQKVSPATAGLAELPERDVKLTGDSAIDLSQDSATAADVFIFGLNVNCSEHWNQININLDESGLESGSDSEKDPDVSLTTSLEDISKLHPDMLLYKAARARNLPVMSEAIAFGASLNWQNEEDGGRTSLIQAVLSGSMTTVEFLLLNGAKVDVCDLHSQTPLHHATILGHTGLVCQFLKRSANHQLTDDNGKDSLTIAMETANADIVTLLRLARLNEEMKELEGGYSLQDETVNEVFRDFTNMANSAPEKLNRNK